MDHPTDIIDCDIPEAIEAPWWHDGRNVTFVANWYKDSGWPLLLGTPARAVAACISIYEEPWTHDVLWYAACKEAQEKAPDHS